MYTVWFSIFPSWPLALPIVLFLGRRTDILRIRDAEFVTDTRVTYLLHGAESLRS